MCFEIDIGKLMSCWIIDSMTKLTDDDIDHIGDIVTMTPDRDGFGYWK